jgi:hypothetical protein
LLLLFTVSFHVVKADAARSRAVLPVSALRSVGLRLFIRSHARTYHASPMRWAQYDAAMPVPTEDLLRYVGREQPPAVSPVACFVVLEADDSSRFVVTHGCARLCGALAELLDDIDADAVADAAGDALTVGADDALTFRSATDDIVAALPHFELPATPRSAVVAALEYVDLCLDRGPPSAIARPLVAALRHLVEPWEYAFVEEHAFAAATSPLRRPTLLSMVLPTVRAGGVAAERHPEHIPPHALLPLTQLMRIADFLLVEPLRDLCCAYLATLVLGKTEAEVAELFRLERPLTEEELEPVFAKHPFLRTPPDATAMEYAMEGPSY